MPHLKSVEGPAAELEEAGLLVEGEELDVDLARRLEDGRRVPHHLGSILQNYIFAENFPAKFSSTNFGQISEQKTAENTYLSFMG
jgi:hypothetical protein